MAQRTMWLALTAAALILGCASQQRTIRGTPVSPDSIGEVRTAAGPNDQTQLTVTVYNLPKPQIVAHDATMYIAWAKPSKESGQPQKLGQLTVDEGVGTLQATTPLREFQLIVTAEPPDSSGMSGEPVLTGHVARD